MRYRRLGEKEWEVVMSFRTDEGVSSSGAGDYLFTLPNGLSFDLTLPWQTAFTGTAMVSGYIDIDEFHWNSLPMSNGDMTGKSASSDGAITFVGTIQSTVLIYDATHFRILVKGPSTGGGSSYVGGPYNNWIGPWGSGLFPINLPVAGNWTFRFTSQ
jgi:hypothetical protein